MAREPLDARQIEILGWAACGLTSVEIGKRMGLSHRTIEPSRDEAKAKLGAKNIPHAIAIALRDKLINFPPKSAEELEIADLHDALT